MSSASARASSSVRQNAPSPTFTSSRIASAPAASFLLITDDAISAGSGHRPRDVAQRVQRPVGRREPGALGGDRDADPPHLLDQLVDVETRRGSRGSPRACRASRPCVRDRAPTSSRRARRTRRRAARARSSSCRRHRPVECLSTTRRPSELRSSRSPDSSIAVHSSSIAGVGEAAEHDRHAPCAHLLRRDLAAEEAVDSSRTEPGGSSSPSRVSSIRTGAGSLTRGSASRGGPDRARPSQAATVAPTSGNQPSCRGPCPRCWAVCATSRACSREWSVEAVVGSQPWSEDEHEQIVGPEQLEQRRQRAVELLQAAVEADGVVAVAVEHVGLDEVHEDEALGRARRATGGWSRCHRRSRTSAPSASRHGPRRRRRSCRRRRPAGQPRRFVSGGSDARARARSRAGARCACTRPGSPSNGRAITRPTACSPTSCRRAMRHASYSSSSGTVCSWAATWKTESADV